MPKFLDRYLAGDYVTVWDELVALGEDVRHKRHYADAAAVAAETMRRARHNVVLLIKRLDEMGFRFLSQKVNDANHLQALRRLHGTHEQVASTATRHLDPIAFLNAKERPQSVEEATDHSRAMALEFMNKALAGQPAPLKNREVLDRPTKQTANNLDQLEKKAGGPLPLSLRAWYEQVGGVSLLGWHSILHPNPDEPAAPFGGCPDPLMIWPLDLMLKMVEEEYDGHEEGEIRLNLAPDETFKSGEAGGDAYWMSIPNKCADGIFEDDNGRTFVNYIRNAFAWGGFPGWEGERSPPREAIARLTEGLFPL